MSMVTPRPIYQKGQKPEKVPALRNAARDETCKLAIPGVCTGQADQTVACHLRFFGIAGAAQKPDDIFMVDGCAACHAAIDSRDRWAELGIGWDDILRALMFTLRDRRNAGLIRLGRQ